MRPRFPGASIVVVDDEPANCVLLERLLAGAGYVNVRSTSDNASVVEQIVGEAPDLVLLDLMMPSPDGYEILESLRDRCDRYPTVLVVTADVSRPALERALGLGARDFVTKPFDRSEVLLRIDRLLEARFR